MPVPHVTVCGGVAAITNYLTFFSICDKLRTVFKTTKVLFIEGYLDA
jgi:hypothetical protein